MKINTFTINENYGIISQGINHNSANHWNWNFRLIPSVNISLTSNEDCDRVNDSLWLILNIHILSVPGYYISSGSDRISN